MRKTRIGRRLAIYTVRGVGRHEPKPAPSEHANILAEYARQAVKAARIDEGWHYTPAEEYRG